MVAPAHLCIGKEKAPNLLASLPIDSFSNEFWILAIIIQGKLESSILSLSPSKCGFFFFMVYMVA